MVSSPSFSVSSFSSAPSSPVPPPREEYRSSGSLGNQSGPQSSSSGVMVGADAKALQALEAIKSHHDFDSTPPCKVDRATTKGKGLVEVPEEPPASRRKLKSVRELHNASARVDSRDYHAIRMCNLPEKAPDAPLEADLRPLTHEILVWQNRKASTKYIRGTLILRLATDLYTLPYEVLIDGVVKVMVRVITSLDSKVNLLHQEVQNLKEGGDLDTMVAAEVRASEAQSLTEHLRVELDEANDRRVSAEADLEIARAESVNLRRQLTDSREQLDDSEGQLRGARTQVRQMETELLELTRSKDALWEDLPRRAIEDYKKSPGFEMGLVRMGRVSLEYGYQLTLARLQARHPRVEIELDPFASLPEDDDMLMANE
ncbi:hypothetical protein BHM03_00049429 [Ensete ventricosum]|nr:hypothetical protein BHM03_00049429 [Ensete ventricosum]